MFKIEVEYKLVIDDKRTEKEKEVDRIIEQYGMFDKDGIWRSKIWA